MDQQELLYIALMDQAWAGLKEHFPDLERIAEEGPRSDDYDLILVRKVFNVALGKLYRDCAQACAD